MTNKRKISHEKPKLSNNVANSRHKGSFEKLKRIKRYIPIITMITVFVVPIPVLSALGQQCDSRLSKEKVSEANELDRRVIGQASCGFAGQIIFPNGDSRDVVAERVANDIKAEQVLVLATPNTLVNKINTERAKTSIGNLVNDDILNDIASSACSQYQSTKSFDSLKGQSLSTEFKNRGVSGTYISWHVTFSGDTAGSKDQAGRDMSSESMGGYLYGLKASNGVNPYTDSKYSHVGVSMCNKDGLDYKKSNSAKYAEWVIFAVFMESFKYNSVSAAPTSSTSSSNGKTCSSVLDEVYERPVKLLIRPSPPSTFLLGNNSEEYRYLMQIYNVEAREYNLEVDALIQKFKDEAYRLKMNCDYYESIIKITDDHLLIY